MKIIFTFLLFTIGLSSFSQQATRNKSDFLISYQLEYKNFSTSESTQSVFTTLIVNDQESLFTFDGMMNFNKIQKEGELAIDDLLINKSPFYFLIKSKGDIVEHFETIGSDSYVFKEKLNNNWKLISQDTIIRGFNCKKATLNYGGRVWTAWYNPEIPITVGPYKFHGLPGLIMSISDSENIFSFIVNEVKRGDFTYDSKIEDYFVKDGGKPFESIKFDEFYKIRKKFSEMSLNEQIKYSNRNEVAVPTLIVQGENADKPRLNNKPKKKNFIERFE